MPWIHLHTNASPSATQKQAWLAETIETLAQELEKPASVFMGAVDGSKTMTFAGSDDPTAMIQFAALGLPHDQTNQLAAILTDLTTEHFELPADRIFIRFEDTDRHMWGFKGKTFG